MAMFQDRPLNLGCFGVLFLATVLSMTTPSAEVYPALAEIAETVMAIAVGAVFVEAVRHKLISADAMRVGNGKKINSRKIESYEEQVDDTEHEEIDEYSNPHEWQRVAERVYFVFCCADEEE